MTPRRDRGHRLTGVGARSPKAVLPGPIMWPGGKGNMRAKIIPLIPWSRIYVEPYGGAASVLAALKPRPVEVYNDLDGNLVNFFRVLQTPRYNYALQRRLDFTPYSRAEFIRARQTLADPQTSALDRAWAFFTAHNQGMGGMCRCDGSWGRVVTSSGRGQAETCSKWRGRVARMEDWIARFARVQIEEREALAVIRQWDTPDTCFYCDPPYVAATRKSKHLYAYEMTDEEHRALVALLLTVAGAVVLSGHDHPLYAPLDQAGWERRSFATSCHLAGRTRGSGLQGQGSALAKVPRNEIVWRNPRALEMMEAEHGGV